jgi:hypothetical protein
VHLELRLFQSLRRPGSVNREAHGGILFGLDGELGRMTEHVPISDSTLFTCHTVSRRKVDTLLTTAFIEVREQ